jgi:hypothetical protein
MESNQQVGFGILNLKISFSRMFNMNMFIDFVAVVFNNHMFKVGISRIHQNTNKGHNFQNRLQVD